MRMFSQILSFCGVFLTSAALATATNAPTEKEPLPGPNAPKEDIVSDPVGVTSGNVYDSSVDVIIPAPDIDLVLRRSYSSSDVSSSEFGYGWCHSFGWTLRISGNEIVVRSAGENGVSDVCHTFIGIEPGQSVKSADGYELVLSEDGLYSVWTPERKCYAFDKFCRLAMISSWNGTCVRIVREETSGRILSAMHESGPLLTFSYSLDGSLTRVDTPDPEVWVEYNIVRNGWRDPVLLMVTRYDHGKPQITEYEYMSLPSAGQKENPIFILPPTGEWAIASSSKNSGSCAKASFSAVSVSSSQSRQILKRKRDANGIETEYSYERVNDGPMVRCVSTEMTGGLLRAEFDYSGYTISISRPGSRILSGNMLSDAVVARDSKGREVERQTGSETRRRIYDAQGDCVAEELVGEENTIKSSSCYEDHRPVAVGKALDANPVDFWLYRWNPRLGILDRIISPEGRIREWVRTDDGYAIFGAGTNDSRLVTHIFCADNERLQHMESSDGGSISCVYDESGYVRRVSQEGFPALDLGYDALGFVNNVRETSSEGDVRDVTWTNNARGCVRALTNPDGSVESFFYDGTGTKVVRHIDALGRHDVYDWTLGLPIRAVRVVDGVTNALWRVRHDARLNVLSVRDPMNRAAESYTLDANERIVSIRNLEGQTMTRSYLIGDLVSSEVRFDGTRVDYGYDSGGRLSLISYPDESIGFAYDRDGLLVAASGAAGIISNSYDRSTGWLDRSVGTDGTTVSYFHSDGGVVTSIVSVVGALRKTIDSAGRPVHVDSPSGRIAFRYDGFGRLASVTGENGVKTSYAYDVMDRVTNITWRTHTGSVIGGFDYAYDVVGRIAERQHSLGTDRFDRSYSYDDRDRLITDGETSYAYDAADNRVSRTESGGIVTSYVLGQGDRLASWTGGSYQYDAAGNVARIVRNGVTLDLMWNSRYQLISVSTNGFFAESYAYDAFGRRVATTNAEGTERHVYDNNWQVIADTDENGNVLRSYVWGEGIDKLLAIRIGSHVYTALTDIQGTVWGYTDEQGMVVARWTYDAWGNVLSEEISPSAFDLRTTRYRFQCRETSFATGLTHFRMRWYDAVTGRWLSKDPIGLCGGINQYAFCDGNAVNLNDPIGMEDESILYDPFYAGLGPWRRGIRFDYRADPFGHGKFPDGSPIDPHIHQYPKKGGQYIRFNLDGSPRNGKGVIPVKDLPTFQRSVQDVLKLTPILKIFPKMPPLMVVPTWLFLNQAGDAFLT